MRPGSGGFDPLACCDPEVAGLSPNLVAPVDGTFVWPFELAALLERDACCDWAEPEFDADCFD